jgi:hypothetical protein
VALSHVVTFVAFLFIHVCPHSYNYSLSFNSTVFRCCAQSYSSEYFMGSSVLYRIVEGQRGKYTRMLSSDCMVQCIFLAVDGYLSGQEVPCCGTCHLVKKTFMNAILSQFNLFHIITIYLRYFFLSFHMYLRLTSTFFSCFRTRILLIILVCPSVLQIVLKRFYWLCVSHLSEGQQIASRHRSYLS